MLLWTKTLSHTDDKNNSCPHVWLLCGSSQSSYRRWRTHSQNRKTGRGQLVSFSTKFSVLFESQHLKSHYKNYIILRSRLEVGVDELCASEAHGELGRFCHNIDREHHRC